MDRDSARLPRRLRSSAGLVAAFLLVAPWLDDHAGASLRWWVAAVVCWACMLFVFVAAVTDRYPWQLLRPRASERKPRRRQG